MASVKRPTVRIATDADYWGGKPRQEDLERLGEIIEQITGEWFWVDVEYVPETMSYGNRNTREGNDILEEAWRIFCEEQ